MLNGDNTDENKQPNLGKDVASATNKDKAELGGAGAGTPGGKYHQAIQAATAAVQGLAGGNLSAPWQVVQRRILLK
ncbi:TPA: hypothetical protein JLB77_000857 [Escherichia coli]|nr:hypothetical protein [Escherichia coli]